MLFNSFVFWGFFATVLALYGVLTLRGQNYLLLAASLFFYGWWDVLAGCQGRFIGLMVLVALVNHMAGLRIAASNDEAVRKRWVTLGVTLSLGVLGLFKYCDFFLDSFHGACQSLGWDVPPWKLNLILPLGISFYTFQALSYTIDIYRRRMEPARRTTDFLLFVTLFPQLVAGPIERASHLLPQVERPRRMTWDGWSRGAVLCLLGLFKKIVVADTLAPLIEPIFRQPEACSSWTLLFGVYCFSIQIYTDFSGYSDIARGLASILGFDLMENFNQPYFSTNVTEFWRRWHVSLSTWLRDYLYIPLGGSREGTGRTYRNLFLTMLLGGLWHGANWTFIVWGGLHGVYLAVHKLLLGGRKAAEERVSRWRVPENLLKGAVTFHLVALAWIFFRADTITRAWAYLCGIAALRTESWMKQLPEPNVYKLDSDHVQTAAWLVAALWLLIDGPQYRSKDHTVLLTWKIPWKVAVFSVLTIWILVTRGGENVPFIYFQF
jgi:D-alanyl-lipoteichoic acid acyltransferase DltB (MBOAT superfamily)